MGPRLRAARLYRQFNKIWPLFYGPSHNSFFFSGALECPPASAF